MKDFNEKDAIAFLTELLPDIATQMRTSMVNLVAAAERLAPPEKREQDAALDRRAAQFMLSSYQLMRLAANLAEAGELADTRAYLLKNGDIIDLCRTLCEKVEAPFELRGVSIEFAADKDHHIIAMEPRKLERLFLNLFSNALKFTPAGGKVTMRVKVSDSFVKIAVSDTGCGIEPERLESLFASFLERGELSTKPYGLGLGLPICRRIARGHGGTIMAESEPGKGATFTVSLPNRRVNTIGFHDVPFDYAGGHNHILVELSDALVPEAFYQKYLD